MRMCSCQLREGFRLTPAQTEGPSGIVGWGVGGKWGT